MDLNFETADLLKEDVKKSDVVADESKPQEKTDSVENKPAESKKDESSVKLCLTLKKRTRQHKKTPW